MSDKRDLFGERWNTLTKRQQREAEESAMVGWESLELEVFRQEQKEMIALKSELIKKWCSMSGCESMLTGVVIEPEKIIALFEKEPYGGRDRVLNDLNEILFSLPEYHKYVMKVAQSMCSDPSENLGDQKMIEAALARAYIPHCISQGFSLSTVTPLAEVSVQLKASVEKYLSLRPVPPKKEYKSSSPDEGGDVFVDEPEMELEMRRVILQHTRLMAREREEDRDLGRMNEMFPQLRRHRQMRDLLRHPLRLHKRLRMSEEELERYLLDGEGDDFFDDLELREMGLFEPPEPRRMRLNVGPERMRPEKAEEKLEKKEEKESSESSLFEFDLDDMEDEHEEEELFVRKGKREKEEKEAEEEEEFGFLSKKPREENPFDFSGPDAMDLSLTLSNSNWPAEDQESV